MIEKLGRFRLFGLKTCQPVWLDEENLTVMPDSAESLNVAVAAGISLYHFSRNLEV